MKSKNNEKLIADLKSDLKLAQKKYSAQIENLEIKLEDQVKFIKLYFFIVYEYMWLIFLGTSL